jgi:sigma-B regulation protein RsbU (phosphoserine phosphatase)
MLAASAPVSPEVLHALRADLPPVIAGIFLSGLAVVVGALTLAFRRGGDRSPLWFSLFTGIYGARLVLDTFPAQLLLGVEPIPYRLTIAALSYLIPVPFALFVRELLGPGWKNGNRRMWQVFLAYAAVVIPIEIVRGAPWSFATPYRILVFASLLVILGQVYRPGQAVSPELRLLRSGGIVLALFVINENLEDLNVTPWQLDIEWVGFLLFLGLLGWIVARRVLEAQRRLSGIEHELETARSIQASILPGAPPRLPGLDVAVRYVPAASVAGDFYDFLPVDGRGLTVVVADVSGHGVPAALIASMIKVAVAAEAADAESPARLLTGMARIFDGQLKSQFITAACVAVDPEAGRLLYAGAGHPPPLLWRSREHAVRELEGGGPILGRFRRALYSETAEPLEPGDRVVLFTDGIPEARNRSGAPFGDERLLAHLAAHAGLDAAAVAGSLLERISTWTGRSGGFEDDLTLIVLGRREAAAP